MHKQFDFVVNKSNQKLSGEYGITWLHIVV